MVAAAGLFKTPKEMKMNSPVKLPPIVEDWATVFQMVGLEQQIPLLRTIKPRLHEHNVLNPYPGLVMCGHILAHYRFQGDAQATDQARQAVLLYTLLQLELSPKAYSEAAQKLRIPEGITTNERYSLNCGYVILAKPNHHCKKHWRNTLLQDCSKIWPVFSTEQRQIKVYERFAMGKKNSLLPAEQVSRYLSGLRATVLQVKSPLLRHMLGVSSFNPTQPNELPGCLAAMEKVLLKHLQDNRQISLLEYWLSA